MTPNLLLGSDNAFDNSVIKFRTSNNLERVGLSVLLLTEGFFGFFEAAEELVFVGVASYT